MGLLLWFLLLGDLLTLFRSLCLVSLLFEDQRGGFELSLRELLVLSHLCRHQLAFDNLREALLVLARSRSQLAQLVVLSTVALILPLLDWAFL